MFVRNQFVGRAANKSQSLDCGRLNDALFCFFFFKLLLVLFIHKILEECGLFCHLFSKESYEYPSGEANQVFELDGYIH